MVLPLNPDWVLMERDIVGAIKTVLSGVSHLGPVHIVERYPETDEEDELLTTTADPVAGANVPLTNYVEIGIPSVSVADFSGRNGVRAVFNYSLSYTLGVKDSWDKDGFPFTSSGQMFIAMYLRCMTELAKRENRNLGFGPNVYAEYLQQDNVGTLTNDEGEALSHFADWSLSVAVERPL